MQAFVVCSVREQREIAVLWVLPFQPCTDGSRCMPHYTGITYMGVVLQQIFPRVALLQLLGPYTGALVHIIPPPIASTGVIMPCVQTQESGEVTHQRSLSKSVAQQRSGAMIRGLIQR